MRRGLPFYIALPLTLFSLAVFATNSIDDDNYDDADEPSPQVIESWLNQKDKNITQAEKVVAKKEADKEAEAALKNHGFIGGGVGFTSASPQTTTNSLNNGFGSPPAANTDIYNTNGSNFSALVDLEGGYQISTIRDWFPAYYVGLRYRYLIDANVTGNVIQLSNDTSFNNYNFTVTSSPQVFTVFGKFPIKNFGHFSPYISAGLGLAVDIVSGYSEASTGATPRQSPDFGSQTNIGMAYEAGMGLDYLLGKKWIFSAEYDYLYLGGSIATGTGSADWSADSLDFGALSANTFLMKVSYLFNT